MIDIEITSGLVTYQGKSAVRATLNDVTDKLKAEAGLRQSEAKYSTVVEKAQDGIIILRGEHVVYSNIAFALCGILILKPS